MKALLALFVAVSLAGPALAGGEVKEVCKDKLDKKGQVVKGKDGKPAQECKKIKVHKKFEGTKVEGTKPDNQQAKKK